MRTHLSSAALAALLLVASASRATPASAPISQVAAAKIADATIAAWMSDSAARKAREIQILDAATFVVSGIWNISSSTIPANAMTARCTDVYQKTGAKWPIVTEHCSVAPKG